MQSVRQRFPHIVHQVAKDGWLRACLGFLQPYRQKYRLEKPSFHSSHRPTTASSAPPRPTPSLPLARGLEVVPEECSVACRLPVPSKATSLVSFKTRYLAESHHLSTRWDFLIESSICAHVTLCRQFHKAQALPLFPRFSSILWIRGEHHPILLFA